MQDAKRLARGCEVTENARKVRGQVRSGGRSGPGADPVRGQVRSGKKL